MHFVKDFIAATTSLNFVRLAIEPLDRHYQNQDFRFEVVVAALRQYQNLKVVLQTSFGWHFSSLRGRQMEVVGLECSDASKINWPAKQAKDIDSIAWMEVAAKHLSLKRQGAKAKHYL